MYARWHDLSSQPSPHFIDHSSQTGLSGNSQKSQRPKLANITLCRRISTRIKDFTDQTHQYSQHQAEVAARQAE